MKPAGTRPAHIAVMVLFAFSCLGLLLFLWLSFGGPVPLKPKGYRFQVAFPGATTLAEQADVRVAGVSVGKVVSKRRDPGGNRTLATIELQRRFAPINVDARAMLRQKTLLGETYVALTTGTRQRRDLREGERLPDEAVDETVELDEVLEIFPRRTRADFRRWQANSARVIAGRDRDLNDALGNLSPFAESGADLLTVLDRRRDALRDLVKNTGVVFAALTRDEDQLRAFVADTARWLQATGAEKQALGESIRIFPTFLREARTTLRRLETFAGDAKPLVDDLGPVARDLEPALGDLAAAAPSLRDASAALPALVTASEAGLPAMSRVLRGIEPVLGATGPLLNQLNPLLQWLQYNQQIMSDIISVPGSAIGGVRATNNPNTVGHVLPQIIVTGSQSVISPQRTRDNRGNAYLRPDAYNFERYKQGYNILPTWDCANAGGEHTARPAATPGGDDPGCFVQEPFDFKGERQRFPRIRENMPRSAQP
jgi:virulence factor Mce-like protein